MNEWAELEAEKLVDAFVAYNGSDDLLRLQGAIAQSLCRVYEMGLYGERPIDHRSSSF